MSLNSWDQYNQSTPKLLPPTAFERTTLSGIDEHNYSSLSSSSPRFGDAQIGKLISELDKLKADIGKLKSENENLRMQNRDFVEQAKLCTEISGHRQISVSTLEEIIHKQALEIQNLKIELNNERTLHANKLSDIEGKLTTKSSELQNKEKDIKKMSDTYESKLSEMKTQHEQNLHERNQKVLDLTTEISELKEKYEQQVAQLRSTIDSLSQEKISIVEEKDNKIRNINEDYKRNIFELENLRSYINESMPTIDKCKQLTQEKMRVEDQLAKQMSKNDVLQKELDAMQIRLKSMNEILQIQEAQLEPKSLSMGQKRQNLLNKWRTKVFELLVQSKCDELSYRQERSLFDKTIVEMSDKLENAHSQHRIFENMLENKKAELYVSEQDNNSLTEQVCMLKDENAKLSNRCEKNLQSTNELRSFVDNLLNNYQKIEESFKTANKKLSQLDQRVEFAKGRLDIIKALNNRKEGHYRDELKRLMDISGNISSIHSSDSMPVKVNDKGENEIVANTQFDNNLMKDELEKVTQERNLLANKLQADMNSMEEKINKMKVDYEGTIHSLNVKLRQYQNENDSKQREIDEIKSDYSKKEDMFVELNRKYDDLQSQFVQLKSQLEAEFQKQFRLKEDAFADKLSQMEQKLNEAKREQAKAIVIMRQMERSTSRDKERMDNLLKESEVYYKSNIDKLQVKIIALEKEKNILMNTIRKNGLSVNLSETSMIAAASVAASQQISFVSSQTSANKQFESVGSAFKQIKAQKNVSSIENANEATSVWLDSKENMAEPNETSKNNELLQQIREIMGNLELSEDEGDDELNGDLSKFRANFNKRDNESDAAVDRYVYGNESSSYRNDREDTYGDNEFELEHAIDASRLMTN